MASLTNDEKITQLWSWAFGNGVKGADERIRDMDKRIDDFSTGAIHCFNGKVIKHHIAWHKESKNFLWAITVPIYLTLIIILVDIGLRMNGK